MDDHGDLQSTAEIRDLQNDHIEWTSQHRDFLCDHHNQCFCPMADIHDDEGFDQWMEREYTNAQTFCGGARPMYPPPAAPDDDDDDDDDDVKPPSKIPSRNPKKGALD